MLLTVGDFQIRDLTEDDVPAIARYANNPKVARTLRDLFPHPYAADDALEFISRIRAEKPPSAFAIATDAEAIGVIGFVPGQDVYRHSAEIGYWIAEEFWGRGIMTEVVKAFAAYLFETYPIHRLYAGTFSSNPASGRVLEKAGFTLEGILKAHVLKDGEILDEHLYAKLRPGLIDD
jgi:RimJ/RimL family protein N-acetyltransferase